MMVCNIAGYQFCSLENLPTLQLRFKQWCAELGLKGTVLLSPEGINIMLAGVQEAIDSFKALLKSDERFSPLSFKESWSSSLPFKRLLVKIKKEAVTMGVAEIHAEQGRAVSLLPNDLKRWLDEGRDFTLLDVRNHYEVEYGTFENAVELGLRHFREFPQAVKQHLEVWKQKPLVMFCTGGIRCEKAGLLLEELGLKEVYQLDGGILNYFSACQGAYFEGDCFVFDERVTLDKHLKPTNNTI